jgi:hypothetical protein
VEGIKELINRYGLGEDLEHIIIPITGKDGRTSRCFLLKHRYLRIMYPDGHYEEYPLEEIIIATVKYPELSLREALRLLHKEMDDEISKIFGDEKEAG